MGEGEATNWEQEEPAEAGDFRPDPAEVPNLAHHQVVPDICVSPVVVVVALITELEVAELGKIGQESD